MKNMLLATQRLIAYAAAKGYHSDIIEAVPGDYELIDFAQGLVKYGKTKYTSAHLKNPEVSLYHDGTDGDQFLTSTKVRAQTHSMLANLANLSECGL